MGKVCCCGKNCCIKTEMILMGVDFLCVLLITIDRPSCMFSVMCGGRNVEVWL